MVARVPLVLINGLPAQLPSGDTVVGGGGGGGAAAITEVEIDFGGPAVTVKKFTITDAAVGTGSTIVALQSGKAATGRAADENEMDQFDCIATPGAGSFTLIAASRTGRLSGKYKINYLIG